MPELFVSVFFFVVGIAVALCGFGGAIAVIVYDDLRHRVWLFAASIFALAFGSATFTTIASTW